MAIVMVLEPLYPYDIGYLKLQFPCHFHVLCHFVSSIDSNYLGSKLDSPTKPYVTLHENTELLRRLLNFPDRLMGFCLHNFLGGQGL